MIATEDERLIRQMAVVLDYHDPMRVLHALAQSCERLSVVARQHGSIRTVRRWRSWAAVLHATARRLARMPDA